MRLDSIAVSGIREGVVIHKIGAARVLHIRNKLIYKKSVKSQDSTDAAQKRDGNINALE
jgi:hypothetical protein